MEELLTMISEKNRIEFVLSAAKRLIPNQSGADKLRNLPVSEIALLEEGWSWITLPEWAADIVPSDAVGLFVPAQVGGKHWNTYNWWLGASALLISASEREHEAKSGSIHSYSFRLDDKMKPAFDYAWVNRIILFLRRWWAHDNDVSENEVFGVVPAAIVHLTHDVDAVSKTLAIRLKQTAFCLYNKRIDAAKRFILRSGDYWQFDHISALEDTYGRRSLWNFYGGRGGFFRSPKEQLFDPAYKINSVRLKRQLKNLSAEGHKIGLHPRFDTWQSAERMRVEKHAIEDALEQNIHYVRQHWLRFSFADTWKAQRSAGLTYDLTLGFNDRLGFRNSAALSFQDPSSGMNIIPMVLMDSHLYDYSDMNEIQQFGAIDKVLDELVATGGEASFIWHQRVFHPDYNWGKTYEYLLDAMRKRRIESPERI